MATPPRQPNDAAIVPKVLLGDIRLLIETRRDRAAQAVNAELVLLYWQIGNRIRREILQEQRAEYGEQIVDGLGKVLLRNMDVVLGGGISSI